MNIMLTSHTAYKFEIIIDAVFVDILKGLK